MDNTFQIKKVNEHIFSLDYSKVTIQSGNEFIINNRICEFTEAFNYQDYNKGIIVYFSGYQNGLFYKNTDGGELYSPATLAPDLITFNMKLCGLKKNSWYRVNIPCKTSGVSTIITDNRELLVVTDKNEVVIDANCATINEYENRSGLFQALENEVMLLFTVGKLYLKDISVDEVTLFEDEVKSEEQLADEMGVGKQQLVAYGIFTTKAIASDSYKGRYIPITKYSGKGINLYFDKTTYQYSIERDNSNDIIGEPFTNLNYIVDLNFNKMVNKDLFFTYEISAISPDISPNTLKQGYIKFDLVDEAGGLVKFQDKDGRFAILIYKLF